MTGQNRQINPHRLSRLIPVRTILPEQLRQKIAQAASASFISPVVVRGVFVPDNTSFSGNLVIVFPIKKPRPEAGFESIGFFRAHFARQLYFIKHFFFGQPVQHIDCKK